ncbi:BLUF domain-containing protein [Pontibacter sp. CAU 1760]
MKGLYRLVYTSSRRATCTDEEIVKILDACKRNNPGLNITGILLHSDKRFLQYLEGYEEQVCRLYELISKDERHGGINKRDFAAIDERLFPGWHMGYKNIDRQTLEFNTAISNHDKELFKTIIEGNDYNEEFSSRVMKTFFDLA